MTGFIPQTLSKIFKNIPVKTIQPGVIPDVRINGIKLDSRLVEPGDLFVALTGGSKDGHNYIGMAVERGAAAVVGTKDISLMIPYIQVEDSRLALAHISAAFYNFPARHMTVIGVTGTDGKTTTANLIYQILIKAGYATGIISTVNAVIGDEVLDTGFHVTTPESPDVQRYLSRMHAAGLTHVVLESTSHGLAQHRVTACEFDIAVVTNITHEHLDYHGTYEAYREAKARLFRALGDTHPKKHGNPRLAVLNRDDQSFEFLVKAAAGRQISYGMQEGADLYVEGVEYDAAGMHFTVNGQGFSTRIDSPFIGSFNISNILGALGATVVGLGIDPQAAALGIAELKGIPGRMENIIMGQDFTATVDFAHTPNALRRALDTAREFCKGRLIAVFGSAGLRDREKRRLMAEESIRIADLTILTAEDPRTESLDAILTEMAVAAVAAGGSEGRNFWRVPDRGEAIRTALSIARAGDVVICCGKGHEQSMCFGETEYPWDDRTALRAALAEKMGIEGPEMPVLPTSRKFTGMH